MFAQHSHVLMTGALILALTYSYLLLSVNLIFVEQNKCAMFYMTVTERVSVRVMTLLNMAKM